MITLPGRPLDQLGVELWRRPRPGKKDEQTTGAFDSRTKRHMMHANHVVDGRVGRAGGDQLNRRGDMPGEDGGGRDQQAQAGQERNRPKAAALRSLDSSLRQLEFPDLIACAFLLNRAGEQMVSKPTKSSLDIGE